MILEAIDDLSCILLSLHSRTMEVILSIGDEINAFRVTTQVHQ